MIMNANEAKQLFTYEPSTGVVRWLVGRNAGGNSWELPQSGRLHNDSL